MSQPATKPIAATSRTPLIDLSPLAPAVGRSAAKSGKLVSTDMNDPAESRTIVDEPMLLAQVSGTPNISSDNAAKLAVADSCPVIEPGLSEYVSIVHAYYATSTQMMNTMRAVQGMRFPEARIFSMKLISGPGGGVLSGLRRAQMTM